MSIFNDLLDIKAFRERKAETEVMRARGEVQLRKQAHQATVAALDAWRAEAVERELALYRELCARIVKLRDIENVQQEVGGFRQTEQVRERAVEEAVAAVEVARDELSQAAGRLLEATRMKEKFVELAGDYDDELRREAERREDLEMEEAASTMHQREELEAWEASQHD